MPDPNNIVPDANRGLNRRLCESRERVPVWETVSVRATKSVMPAAEGDGASDTNGNFYDAKIFHVDKPNQNGRVYTRKNMQANLDRLKPILKDGMFNGSVDHGTGLRNQVVMWKSLKIDPDGSGLGKFSIVPGHSVGEDLRKQIDAGMSVGFSTYGYGTAHRPSDEEAEMYGCDPEDHVVMNDDYEMVKCDPVDDPSVPDARIKQPTQANPPIMPANNAPPATVPGAGGYDNRNGSPVAENKQTVEACSKGIHWVERGACGHMLSRCPCECEDSDRQSIWRGYACDACKQSGASMSVAEFKSHVAESKKRVSVAEAQARKPLSTYYTQYIQSKDGDSFDPVGAITTTPKLTQDAYRIASVWGGVRFERMSPQTDDLYRFPNSVMEKVIGEIDKFWDLKPKFDKLGLLHNRGLIMEGPPGTGKTSAVNQVVELIVSRGDVVFYADSVYTLLEGLKAFREVESERKVVVVLEDADQYVGYQERAMLQLLDGEQSVGGVLYLATTNYISRFPERLLRPGRFDKQVHVGPPPYEGRKVYLTKKLDGIEKPEEIDRLAKETDGLSFGHLRELITAVYALSEPVNDVLARLKGKHKNTSRTSSRLNERQEESRMAVTEASGSVHLNHAAVGKAMAAARAGKVDHGPFSGDATERSAANADKFLGVDTSFTPDEKGHYKYPIFTGDKVSAKGVGTAGHYADAAGQSDIHAATVKISDAIKEHEKPEQPGDSRMSQKVIEAINKFLEAANDVPEINLPQREVLPGEFKEQLDKATSAVAERDQKIAALEAEKSELQKQIDSFKASEAQSKRIADVTAKAESLLKDNSFADLIRPRLAEAAKAESFVAENVEAFIQAKTAEYDAVVGRKPAIDTSVSGVNVDEADLDDLDDLEQESADPKEDVLKVEAAPELAKMFGGKSKKK